MLWCINANMAASSPWHTHEVFELMLCIKKGGRLVTRHAEIDCLPERTILIPPQSSHCHHIESGETIRCKIMCLSKEDVAANLSPVQSAMLHRLCAKGVSYADHTAGPVDIDALSRMIQEGFGAGDAMATQVNWSVLSMLLALHAKAQRPMDQEPHQRGSRRHDERIQTIMAWLDQHSAEPHTIDQVAAAFGFSRSLLTREFKRITGKSIVEYLNERRVEKAALSLVIQSADVAEAAYANGFSNLSHFHRLFKMQYGLTPKAFRCKIIEEGGLKMAPGAAGTR